MSTVIWVPQPVVLAIHGHLLAEHGGAQGVRDVGLLESALARPEQLNAYGTPDLFDLAASYTIGLVKNHPFVDGNKRTGFMVGYVFLGRNGHRLMADEAATTQTVLAVAAGEIDENSYANWLRRHC